MPSPRNVSPAPSFSASTSRANERSIVPPKIDARPERCPALGLTSYYFGSNHLAKPSRPGATSRVTGGQSHVRAERQSYLSPEERAPAPGPDPGSILAEGEDRVRGSRS